jgi:Uma2 family endonuclease
MLECNKADAWISFILALIEAMMVDQIAVPSIQQDPQRGEPIPFDEYMARYAHDHYEWVNGEVIQLSPVSLKHFRIVAYLQNLLGYYFALNPVGQVVGEPFVLKLDAAGSGREPDLQVILNTNPGQLTDTAMIGAPDICIEVVSAESVARDYGDKFLEYEKAGVKEYWIIDPIRKACRFNRLGDRSLYTDISMDAQGEYQTPILPKLRLHVPTLWQENLPDYYAIADSVRSMWQA